MLAIPTASVFIFYLAVHLSDSKSPPTELPEYLLNLTVCLVAVVVFVPTLFVISTIIYNFMDVAAKFKRGEELSFSLVRDNLLDLTIHAVPFGILSLSMLFEYPKFRDGQHDGLAALASIMILFILAELGLFLFHSVKRAEKVSDDLDKTFGRVDKKLNVLPWMEPYLKLAMPNGRESGLVETIGAIITEYAAISSRTDELNSQLVRHFLHDYLAEELKDLKAVLEDQLIPKAVVPPFSDKEGNVSYFATNVGFYGKFLDNAVKHLAGHATKDGNLDNPLVHPCIAVITNALPSQFWLWPRDDRYGEDYLPIAEYRKAQIEGVAKGRLRIFRSILVADDENNGAADAVLYRSRVIPVLWSKTEWTREAHWNLVFHDTDHTKLYRVDEAKEIKDEYLVPHLRSWVSNAEERRSGYVMTERPINLPCEEVWRHYCKHFHLVRSEPRGRTDILKITKKQFYAALPNGLNGCPDIMFLGVCKSDVEDVWKADISDSNWALALMTTMSTQTETMFLTLIHEPSKVAELWRHVRKVRNLLDEQRIISSDSVWQLDEAPATSEQAPMATVENSELVQK
jgi:hypothetical protein